MQDRCGNFKIMHNEMNFERNMLTLLSLAMILFFCAETEKRSEELSGVEANEPKQKLLVDYKKDIYKISVGDNYKKSDKIIDWHWASENDDDRIIDSTGRDAFMYLGEPLIKYNNSEWLPTLHIETDKDIITSFTCSVLFNLSDSTNAQNLFLRLLSKDVKQLKNDEVIKSLIEKGIYEKKAQDYIETFTLIKGKDYEHDRFKYTVKPRQKNGK